MDSFRSDSIFDSIDDVFLTYACSILADTNRGLSGSKIVTICALYAVRYNRSIPQSNYPFFPRTMNKRSALKQNLEAFSAKEQFVIIEEMSNCLGSEDADVKQLLEQLYSKYGDLAYSDIVQSVIVKETKHWLSDYPDAFRLYDSALRKYGSGIFQRNTLDDLRLSFELLLKTLLCNDKSIENQVPEVCDILDRLGVSVELKNMFHKVLEYYTKYQNHHVKHDDSANPEEIEFVIELTSMLMKFVIKASKMIDNQGESN